MRFMKFGSMVRGRQLVIAGSAALLLSVGLAGGAAAGNDYSQYRCGGQTGEWWASQGYNVIYGDDNDNTLNGTAYADVIYGFGGHDAINGYDEHDLICAGYGDDEVFAGYGEDYVSGGDGEDLL